MTAGLRLAFAAAFLLSGMGTSAGAERSPWEKLHEQHDKNKWLLAVWADEGGWFAAGRGVLLKGGPGGTQPEPLGERTVVGFSGESRAELLAVGWDQLVLRLDGNAWVEDHFVAGPPRGKRGRNADDLLQSVVPLPIGGKVMLVAVGPWLVLVRQPDQTWRSLPEEERYKVTMLAHAGPPFDRPLKCAVSAWNWVGKDRALFACHDSRSFIFSAGKTTPMGLLPRACKQGVDHSVLRGAEAYTLCYGRLWRSDGARWQRIPGPEGMRDFAITDRCLYGATDRAVWRRCER